MNHALALHNLSNIKERDTDKPKPTVEINSISGSGLKLFVHRTANNFRFLVCYSRKLFSKIGLVVLSAFFGGAAHTLDSLGTARGVYTM